MHAASDRGSQIGLGKRAALALAATLSGVLAGCSNGHSDVPTLRPPVTAPPTGAKHGPAGPAVMILTVAGVPVPQLAGKAVANAALRQAAAKLGAGCQVADERDDPKVASFLWTCGTARPTAATVDLRSQRSVALGDLFQGDYLGYLTSTASTQLEANGASSTQATDLSVWYLTPDSFVVIFPAGTVSFPLPSLASYVRSGGALSAS